MKTVTSRPAFQGDVVIMRVNDIPDGLARAKPAGDYYIIAHSETGHHHVLPRAGVEVHEPADEAFIAWVRVLDRSVRLEHQRAFDTHESLELPAGNYQVRRQREYVPGGYRRAAD